MKSKKKKLSKRTFGCLSDGGDYRDTVLLRVLRAEPRPAKVDLRARLPKKTRNQGQEGACTGFAGAGDIFAALAFAGQRLPDDDGPSEAFLYYNARRLHGTTDEDSGASIRNLIKAAVKWGFVRNSAFPYKAGDYARKPSAAVYKQAEKGIIESYARVGGEGLQFLENVLDLLAGGDPIVAGFDVPENFDEAGKTGRMPKPKGKIRGGHAVLIVGYDAKRRVLFVRNSWGDRWGKAGHFEVPFDVFTIPGLWRDLWTVKIAAEKKAAAPLRKKRAA